MRIEKRKELEYERLANRTRAEEARKAALEKAAKEEEARIKAAEEAALKR